MPSARVPQGPMPISPPAGALPHPRIRPPVDPGPAERRDFRPGRRSGRRPGDGRHSTPPPSYVCTPNASPAMSSAFRCAATAAAIELAEEHRGRRSRILLYEEQEGRGIGLMGKLRAYELQDQGRDTIEANLELGYEADCRHFELPAQILKQMGASSPSGLLPIILRRSKLSTRWHQGYRAHLRRSRAAG